MYFTNENGGHTGVVWLVDSAKGNVWIIHRSRLGAPVKINEFDKLISDQQNKNKEINRIFEGVYRP